MCVHKHAHIHTSTNMYTCTYIHATKIIEKRDRKYEKGKGVYGRFEKRKKRERCNHIIISNIKQFFSKNLSSSVCLCCFSGLLSLIFAL